MARRNRRHRRGARHWWSFKYLWGFLVGLGAGCLAGAVAITLVILQSGRRTRAKLHGTTAGQDDQAAESLKASLVHAQAGQSLA